MKKIFFYLAMSIVSCMALTLSACSKEELETQGEGNSTEHPNEELDEVTTPGYSWYAEDNESGTPLLVTEKGEIALKVKEEMDKGISISVFDKDREDYLREDAYTIRVLNADKVDSHVIYYTKNQNWTNDPNPIISLFVMPMGGGETSLTVEVATKEANPQVVLRRTFKFIVLDDKPEDKNEGVDESDDIAAKGYTWQYWNSNFDGWNSVVLTSSEIQMNLGDEVIIKGANKGRPLLDTKYTMKVVNANDIDDKVIEYKIDLNDYEDDNTVDLKAVGVGHTNIQVEIATKEANPQVVLRRTFKFIVLDDKPEDKNEGVDESDDIAAKGYSWQYWNSNFDGWKTEVLTSSEIQMNLGDHVMIEGANKGWPLLQREYTMKVVNANDIDNKVIEHKIDPDDEYDILAVTLKAVGVGHTNIQVEIATKEANPQVVLRRTFKVIVTE